MAYQPSNKCGLWRVQLLNWNITYMASDVQEDTVSMFLWHNEGGVCIAHIDVNEVCAAQNPLLYIPCRK